MAGYGYGMPTHADLIRRAHAAWLTHNRGGAEPTWSATTVEVLGGRTYVVLRRGGEVTDIYRYKPSTPGARDTLVLLKRTRDGAYWPRPYGSRLGELAAV
jgi:hypothetical protein